MLSRDAVRWAFVVGGMLLLGGCELSPEQLMERGLDRMREGDYAGALADFDAVVKLQPNDVGAIQWRARMYEFNREYRLALHDYNEAIRLGTSNSTAYSNRGYILATAPDDSLRNGQAALADMQQAIKMEGEVTYLLKPKLATVYTELGDFQTAIRLQEEFVNQPDEFLIKDAARERLAQYRVGKPYRAPAK
ncbi:MAG: hypothetical protein RIC55_00145 [Pirellulaceae bacterium]